MPDVVRASARPVKTARRRGAAALLAVLLAAATGAAQDASPAGAQRAESCGPGARDPRVVVRVTGARRAAGNVAVTLYGADPERFLARGGRLARLRVPLGPEATSAEACFAVSGPGTYAVVVYHDENDDRTFNRNLLGLPAEGYGFSRDAPATVGLPGFRDAAFDAGLGTTRVPVALRY